MKSKLLFIVLCLFVVTSLTAYGQMIKRSDVVWARTTTNKITLDGKLTEPDWAKADSINVVYGKDNGMPGSGWNTDGYAKKPTDPIHATVKFLINGDSLYVAVICPDSSIGGGLWPGPAKFDGLLIDLRNKSGTDRPVPSGEIFYGWVAESWADSNTAHKGALPGLFGQYGGSRTDSVNGVPKGKIWDAVTYVQGTTNDDSSIDTAWTTEFKFNLKFFGYNAKQAAGDIVMFSIGFFDADWQWFTGADTVKNRFNINKAWAQDPWGNANNNNHIRLFVRPDVTPSSGAVPIVGPDFVIPGAGSYAAPNFDGKLDDPVWSNANIGTLKLQYGNNTYRNAYPYTDPFRSGQYQPTVNNTQAAITDANDATIKYFYKADTLYLGFDVKDKVVQSVPSNLDRWYGFRVTLNARDSVDGDNVQLVRRLTFIIDSVGNAMRMEDLTTQGGWDSLAQAVQVKTFVNGTVDTMGTTPDVGYTAEMKINLRKFGYPAGRGDGVIFLGVCMFDGDSYGSSYTLSYGSRVWFMRENAGVDGAGWLWMDPSTVLTRVGTENSVLPKEFKLLGNYPNPFNPSTTIKFSLPQTVDVTLEVYDILGRIVYLQNLGIRQAGIQQVTFDASRFASGVYNYRLRTAANQVVVGRMMLLK